MFFHSHGALRRVRLPAAAILGLAALGVWSASWGAVEVRAQAALERVERDLLPPPIPAANEAAAAGPQAYLGATTDDQREAGRGLRVIAVRPGGPAAEGQLQTGDLIVAANGAPVRTNQDLAPVLRGAQPGDPLSLDVIRGEQTIKLSVRLGTRPGKPVLGVVTRTHLDAINSLRGALIVEVSAGSPAEQAGLAVGDLIATFQGQPVAGNDPLATLVAAALPGEAVEIGFYRGRRLQVATVLLGDSLQPPPTPAPQNEAPPAAGLTDRQRIELLEKEVLQLRAQLQELQRRLAPAP